MLSNLEIMNHNNSGNYRRNRWGESLQQNKVANLINLPLAITGRLTPEQLEAYALNIRIEEITQKLRLNDIVPNDGDRSPSPPPQYDSFGKRTNTREVRYKQNLEDERHKLVEKALKTIPSYKPPADYRRPQRTQEKIYIPVNDYPEINFIGLLIGPRGRTLKKMEEESGAKIAIRGKGSVKEGKGRDQNLNVHNNMEEDLHCLIISDSEQAIQKAIELVNGVIETAASIPEGQNELKRGQLRELAALNGTLRDDENQPCQNCGEVGHRKYDCPNRKNFTASVICRVCGQQGHFARDCKERHNNHQHHNRNYTTNGSTNHHNNNNNLSIADREYEQLMRELGGQAPPPAGAIEASPNQQRMAPWQQRNSNVSNANTIPLGNNGSWQRNSNDYNNNPWNKPIPKASFDPFKGIPVGSNSSITAPNMGIAPPGLGAPGSGRPQSNAYVAPPGLSGPPGFKGMNNMPGSFQMGPPGAIAPPSNDKGSAMPPPPPPPAAMVPPPPPPSTSSASTLSFVPPPPPPPPHPTS